MGTRRGMTLLLLLFALSGVAALVYEVVWFQLLRMTIGADAQSLGILLACFMGGLFVGSLGYARCAPRRWNPLRTYATIELAIGTLGLLMPHLIGWLRAAYLAHAGAPQTALLLRCLICVGLLMPPTILMGATLPALARWVKADERQAGAIGWLYAANVIGAVAGAFGAAFLLMPVLHILGANYVAVGLNVFVALLAGTMRRDYVPPVDAPAAADAQVARQGALAIYLAYALNGMAALSFEVVWSRLLAMAFAATVYAFAMVLGVFLLGLGLGGAVGSAVAGRLPHPRRTFAALQLCIVAAVGATAVFVPMMAEQFLAIDRGPTAGPLVWSLTNLVRALVVVFPGAFLWGMSFPIALVCLGRNLGDAAQPVGRLYAFNTVGAVVGSLATSFVLFPRFGSAAAAGHLVLLPLAAALVLLMPKRTPGWLLLVPTGVLPAIAYLTAWPSAVHEKIPLFVRHAGEWPVAGWLLGALLVVVTLKASATRVRYGGAFLLAAAGLVLALGAQVPVQLYMLGRRFGAEGVFNRSTEILYFAEGAMEPVVVFHGIDGSLQVSINSKICATSQPDDMLTQRMLAHVPVLLSRDPRHVVVVGLGAGVTAGAAAIHDGVERVDVIELEPKVRGAARTFAAFNDHVLDNPKVHVTIGDGRHFIAASPAKFGVITSDPVDPWMAGAAALYTAEHFKRCRAKLVDGGTFVQWVGMYELSLDGMRAILAAFAEAFPDGGFWITESDVLLVGSTDRITVDVAALRRKLEGEPALAESLREVGIHGADAFLSHYLCSCASMRDWLAGAPVNRDGNLYVQFSGGFSYYAWNYPQLREALMKQRAWDEGMFILPSAESAEFRATLEGFWEKYDHRARRDIERWRRVSQRSPGVAPGR